MGRKLDLSGLTDDEANHVLRVVQRDMRLRETEEARLSEMRQRLDEERSRCSLLSRQRCFNERCCMRCCSPFSLLLNPRRLCLDCSHAVCKACCSTSTTRRGWICSTCQNRRLLKSQSLEWFYSDVRRRFKRFGSAKVLKNLYRKHRTQQGGVAELTEGSTCGESVCNDSSVYESDSTFYRQTEEHSMVETIGVALRVAEDAIDEAIAKAESQRDNEEKQREAQYLRENRGELIEELASTIVQKIIRRRRDLAELQPDRNLGGPAERTSELVLPDCSSSEPQTAVISHAGRKAPLWRSQSAFSVFIDDALHQPGRDHPTAGTPPASVQGLTREGSLPNPTLPSWRSVDRLDSSRSSSALKSPDGNWMALQSTLLSRPSLLAKRKSQVFSVLERESGVVSAYDEMGSDTEAEAEGNWGAALLEFRRKMTAHHQGDPESYSRQATLVSPGRRRAAAVATAAAEAAHPDPESPEPPLSRSSYKTLLAFLKRKGAQEHRRASSSRRPSVMDINFNPAGAESSEDGLEDSRVKRSRRKRRSRKEEVERREAPASEPECFSVLLDTVGKKQNLRLDTERFLSDQGTDADSPDTATPDMLSSGAVTPDRLGPGGGALHREGHGAAGDVGSLEQQLASKLIELSSQVREVQLSSTEDELDKVTEIQGDRGSKARERDGAEMWGQRLRGGAEAGGESGTDTEGEEQMGGVGMAEMVIQAGDTLLFTGGRQLAAALRTESQGELGRSEKKGNVLAELLSNAHKETGQEEPEAKGEPEIGGAQEAMDDELDVDWNLEARMDHEGKQQSGYSEGLKVMEEDVRAQGEKPDSEKEVEDSGDRVRKTREQMKLEIPTKTLGLTESESKRDRQGGGIKRSLGKPEQKNQRIIDRKGGDEHEEYGGGDVERLTDCVVKASDKMEREIDAHVGEGGFIDEGEPEITEEEQTHIAVEKLVKTERYSATTVKEIREAYPAGRSSIKGLGGTDYGLSEKLKGVESPEEKDMGGHLVGESMGMEESEPATKTEDQCPQDSAPSVPEEFLSPEEIYKKYSAVSLRSITTEVLKVLNATEDLIQGAADDRLSQSQRRGGPVLPLAETRRLDEQLGHLEENVYVAAGGVFGLEAELGELEECARGISSGTTERELAHLEEQVASAAAQVQQAELQVSDIAVRIAALKSAGLNVAPQTRPAKGLANTQTQTLDSTRQRRRRLPAPPGKGLGVPKYEEA